MAGSEFVSCSHFPFYTTSNILCPLASMTVYGNPPENPTTPITLAFSKIKNRQVNTYPAPKSLKHKSFKFKNNFIVKGCTVHLFPAALNLLTALPSRIYGNTIKCQLTTVNQFLILHLQNVFIINGNTWHAH